METINNSSQVEEQIEQVNIVDRETNSQVENILKMESRNLNYAEVTNNLVNQLQEYLLRSKQK
jgi:hypothetical protein